MIILDTNVISEPLRPSPDAHVTAWLDRQSLETLFITATTLAEVLLGVAQLPDGKRKFGLAQAVAEHLVPRFASRILPFDAPAARAYATMMAQTRRAGHAISVSDGQIAAIALHHGFTVATRDTAPFLAAGVAVINPWFD